MLRNCLFLGKFQAEALATELSIKKCVPNIPSIEGLRCCWIKGRFLWYILESFGAGICQNLPESLRIYWNLYRIFRSLGILSNLLESFGIFWNFGIFRNYPESLGILFFRFDVLIMFLYVGLDQCSLRKNLITSNIIIFLIS